MILPRDEKALREAISAFTGHEEFPVWLDEQMRRFVRASRAANTIRAYRADFADFELWCEARRLSALPARPETVAAYLADRAEALSPATLSRRIAAISAAHRAAGYGGLSVREEPLRSVWAGIRRTKGTAPAQKAPIFVEELRCIVEALPRSLLGLRDRALLLLGFAGAFRRSELVGLDVDDLEFVPQGLVVRVKRSKTDQEGEGRLVGIPYGRRAATCPVRAVQAWLEASKITAGPVFRPIDRHENIRQKRLSDRAVALIIKRSVEACGLDPTRYSGHSLRAGLATSAAAAGVEERLIMAQTGHKSERIVRRYIREGDLFRKNVVSFLDL